MKTSDYINNLNNNINLVIDSNIKELIELTLDNYYIYHNYFVSLQSKLVNTKVSDVKLNVLNYFHMHSTYLLTSLINTIMIDDCFSSHINLRTFIEFYFKYNLILYSDNFVSELYNDFIVIYKAYDIEKYNLYTFTNKSKEIEEIMNQKKDVLNKYDIDDNGKPDRWIKIALNYNDSNTKYNKSIKDLINWLEKKDYISKSIIKAYEKECEFIHCNIYSMDAIQIASKNKECKMYVRNYMTILLTTNLLMLTIIADFMETYTKYNDETILNVLNKNVEIISKSANEFNMECD